MFPAGYLGVDVFFVISGFVITKSLMGRDSTRLPTFLKHFFFRRIRRLVPALLMCVAISCLILLLLDPTPRASFRTALAALFGLANISIFAQELDYFAASTKYNAFTHMWSLGVEEQFYFLFPFLFWWLFRPERSSQKQLIFMICALSLASLIGFLILFKEHNMAAYFLSPFRFWQIGFDVVLALSVRTGALSRGILQSKRAFYISLLLLVAALAVPIDVKPWGHILVCILAGVLILLGEDGADKSTVLTAPVATYIGRVSYSLYLWHWPILTFGLLAPQTLLANTYVSLSLMVGCSVASYHLIERPFQAYNPPQPNYRHFLFALSSVFLTILVLWAGYELRKTTTSPLTAQMPPAFAPLPESNLPFNPTCVVDNQTRFLTDLTFDQCTFEKESSAPTLWVMGDSHAGHLQAGLLKILEQSEFGVHLIETPGNPFPVTNKEGFAPRAQIYEDIQENWKPGDIVVAARLYFQRTDPVKIWDDYPVWLEKTDRLAQALRDEGIGLLLVGPAPMFNFEDTRACNPQSIISCAVERDTLSGFIEQIQFDLDLLADRHPNVVNVNLFEELCPPSSPVCSPAVNGQFIYRDRDHLNVEGARLISSKLLEKAEELIQRPN